MAQRKSIRHENNKNLQKIDEQTTSVENQTQNHEIASNFHHQNNNRNGHLEQNSRNSTDHHLKTSHFRNSKKVEYENLPIMGLTPYSIYNTPFMVPQKNQQPKEKKSFMKKLRSKMRRGNSH